MVLQKCSRSFHNNCTWTCINLPCIQGQHLISSQCLHPVFTLQKHNYLVFFLLNGDMIFSTVAKYRRCPQTAELKNHCWYAVLTNFQPIDPTTLGHPSFALRGRNVNFQTFKHVLKKY